MADACKGIDTIVCTATSMPAAGGDALQRVDQDGVLGLIAAAERAGVRRFVYTSFSSNIRVDSPLVLAKRSCEARTLAESSMQSVILQPSFFMEVWLGPHMGFDAARAFFRPLLEQSFKKIRHPEFEINNPKSERDATVKCIGGLRFFRNRLISFEPRRTRRS